MNPLSIAFLSRDLPSLHPNGASCQVHLLANALVARGHRVTVWSRDPAPPDAAYTVMRDSKERPGRLFRLFRPAAYFAQQNYSGYDLVHAHGDDFLAWPSQPRIRTFYGSALYEAMYDDRPLYRLRQALFYLFEWVSLANAAAAVGISKVTQRALPAIRHVVPCCVDDRFYRSKIPKTPHPSILFVGNLSGRKRGELLLRIFSEQIRPRYPQARLILATSEKIGSLPGVEVSAKPDLEQLADLYAKAWVLCSTSTYEGFGVPIIEAWASGTPVLTTPHQGARELIHDRMDGLISPPEQLGTYLDQLLSDENLRAGLARQGRCRAEDLRSNRIAEQYEGVYHALLKR